MNRNASQHLLVIQNITDGELCSFAYAGKTNNAGSPVQKSINKLLQKHTKYPKSYIDDVSIFSQTWEGNLEQIFRRIRNVGLTVNLENISSIIMKWNSLDHVHVIWSENILQDLLKVETIRKISKPSRKKEPRSLLILTSY